MPENKAMVGRRTYYCNKRSAHYALHSTPQPTGANIQRAKSETSAYYKLVFSKKRDHWNEYVLSVRGKAIWKAYQYFKQTESRGVMPPLQRADGSLAQTPEDKEEALLKVYTQEFPPLHAQHQVYHIPVMINEDNR